MEVRPVISNRRGAVDVTPSASRLTGSLRDIGYDLPSAVADIVDNSISAGASRIDVELCFDDAKSYVIIADDGSGMSDSELVEAMRFGSRRRYGSNELGRFGLGLKTASLSQCRRVTVVTRRSPVRRRLAAHTLDLDHVEASDRWEVLDPFDDTSAYRALEWLNANTGTVVVWEQLDRILPDGATSGGWARRRLNTFAERTADHLGIVFHRFLEGIDGADPLVITVNGKKLGPWNPFAPREPARIELPKRTYEVFDGAISGHVVLTPFVLPARSLFSSLADFESLSGPGKWNRQQGLYIYRANRLIQSGGWCGIRGIDEHTKLARAAVDFSSELDELFQINVAKMRVQLPAEIRSVMEPHISELCQRAQEMYRRDLREGGTSVGQILTEPVRTGAGDLPAVGAAILSAAMATKNAKALDAIIAHLEAEAPDIVIRLGW
jgi:hypothetical protein